MERRQKIKSSDICKFIFVCLIGIMVFAICINTTNSAPKVVETQGQVDIQTDKVVTGNLEIYFLNVGQADCTLILHNDSAMLIDAGNVSDGEEIVEFIKGKNIDKLDIVIGTHVHEDHLGRNG